MKLVIVESPTKCLTIQKYLGDNYIVKASKGHIRDLATSGKGGLGVDVDNGFIPNYVVNKWDIVRELQTLARKSDEVIIATDPDREGEAIAWHLAQVLKLDVATNKRLEFHEITRQAITYALENPRTIDINTVNSQESRRIIDRIIGFKLSTLVNRQIRSKSAGRVQSATLKIIVDRDKEINSFVPEDYYELLVEALMGKKSTKLTYKGINGKETKITTLKQMEEILNDIPETLTVIKAEKKTRVIESPIPFTTSMLQQEAFNKLKFSAGKTQSLAQSLYEGIEINSEHVGFITYIRTDSSTLSASYVSRAFRYIEETYGKNYIGVIKKGKESKTSQGAHEAIRPTSNHRTPESVKNYLTKDQYLLYKLIYNRTVASLMKGKKQEVLDLTLKGGNQIFTLSFSRTIFDGYSILYKDDEKESGYVLPSINVGDELKVSKKEMEKKATQPPSHYSDAKIIKTMEDLGIGRPSTYASTIETLKERKYIESKGGFLIATEQGVKTSDMLDKYFPMIVDSKYTANMEEELDLVEEGKETRDKLLTEFYDWFTELYKKGTTAMTKERTLEEKCPVCGAPLIVRHGRNGEFIGCSHYPECNYIKPSEIQEDLGRCPNCGKPLVKKNDKNGRTFIACSGYPRCKYIVNDAITDKVCPNCGGRLVRKKGKYGYFLGCENYPNCNYMEKENKKRSKR